MRKARRKVLIGEVVSNKMDKTVVVAVERIVRHPIISKPIRKTARFKAHDEHNQAKVGDVVEIVETRPLSKEKRWRVRKIIKTAD